MGYRKTSCIRALQALENGKYTGKSIDTPSTIAVEICDDSSTAIRFDEEHITFSVWDFAGQLEYLTTHQYFLSSRNAIYVIMVDSSAPLESQEAQLEHWADFLQSKLPAASALSSDGKRGSTHNKYLVTVVGTKKDRLPSSLGSGSNSAVQAVRSRLQQVLRRYPRLPVSGGGHHVHLISVLDAKSLHELRAMVRRAARGLLSHPDLAKVPRYYADVKEQLSHWARDTDTPSFLTLDDVSQRLAADTIQCDENAIQYLHDIGVVVYAKHKRSLCLRPQLLAKVMAIFVCPEEHLERLTQRPAPALAARHAIVSKHAAKRRIELLVSSGELSGPEFRWEDGDRTLRAIMHMLECFDMCYQLTANEVRVYEEPGYLFPALRPWGELFLLPPPTTISASPAEQQQQHQQEQEASDTGEEQLDKTMGDDELAENHDHDDDDEDDMELTSARDDDVPYALEDKHTTFEAQTSPTRLTTEGGSEAPRMRYMGKRVQHRTSGAKLSNELFFRLQVRLRPFHDYRYKLYANGMILTDHGAPGYDNAALVVLERSGFICIVVRGISPATLMQHITDALLSLEAEIEGLATRISWLCPTCIQVAGNYTTFLGCRHEHTSKIGVRGRNEDLGDDADEQRLVAADGGALEAVLANITARSSLSNVKRWFLEDGVPLDPRLLHRNVLWDPKAGDAFYEDARLNARQWQTKDPNGWLKVTGMDEDVVLEFLR